MSCAVPSLFSFCTNTPTKHKQHFTHGSEHNSFFSPLLGTVRCADDGRRRRPLKTAAWPGCLRRGRNETGASRRSLHQRSMPIIHRNGMVMGMHKIVYKNCKNLDAKRRNAEICICDVVVDAELMRNCSLKYMSILPEGECFCVRNCCCVSNDNWQTSMFCGEYGAETQYTLAYRALG